MIWNVRSYFKTTTVDFKIRKSSSDDLKIWINHIIRDQVIQKWKRILDILISSVSNHNQKNCEKWKTSVVFY